MSRQRGFTLIESLAVIAIIGILATLAATITIGAQKNGRDAKRKSDLLAISQGLEARFLDKTCTDPSLVGKYPHASGSGLGWVPVSRLAPRDTDTDCLDFSNYLRTLPDDPQANSYHYYYNISLTSSDPSQTAKHYRLAASLERSSVVQSDCQHASSLWVASFGQPYDCVVSTAIGGQNDAREYLYYIGK